MEFVCKRALKLTVSLDGQTTVGTYHLDELGSQQFNLLLHHQTLAFFAQTLLILYYST